MDARDHIMGSSSAGYSFLLINQSVLGQIITEPKVTQQRNFHDGQPAFWPSGDAKLQTVFQIKTQLRNYEGISKPDTSKPDDGVRTLFIKGKHMEKAVKEAILGSGAGWLEVGGWIEVTYTGDDMSSKAASKPKFFAVRYQPPAPGQQAQQPAQGYQGATGGYPPQAYQDQGYPAQQPPRPPQPVAPQSQPNWQQAGWTPQAPPPLAPPQFAGAPITQYPPAPAVPSHHGQADQMPQWAQAVPASAVPAPSSAPPAPALSTLELIAAQQASGSPDYGQVEPTF